MNLTDAKTCTIARLNTRYNEELKKGRTIFPDIIQSLEYEKLNDFQLQYDVLSVDPTNDANGYILLDINGKFHTGLSKTDYETALLNYKKAGLNIWKEWKGLLAQVDGCTTIVELDSLDFI